MFQLESFTTKKILLGTTAIIIISILIGTTAIIIISILIGAINGALHSGFDEGKFGTLASVALLALIGITSFQIFSLRKQARPVSFTSRRLVWWLIGLGFVFLALDDLLQIHENVDKLIHSLFAIRETALTDRIDDLLILGYGIIGLVVLLWCREEILKAKGLLFFLAIGFILVITNVGIDVLTNRDEYLSWFSISAEHAQTVKQTATIFEESTKLIAEAILLAGFTHTLRFFQSKTSPI